MELLKKENLLLPQKRKYTFDDQYDGSKDKNGLLVEEIRKLIEATLFSWELPIPENFQFNLPETIFTGTQNVEFKVENNFEVDYAEDNRNLSTEQYQEIWQEGQFSIKSKRILLIII